MFPAFSTPKPGFSLPSLHQGASPATNPDCLNRFISTLAVPERAPTQLQFRAAVEALPGVGAAFRTLTRRGRGGSAALSAQRVSDLQQIAAAFSRRTPAFVEAKLDRYLRGAPLQVVLEDTDLREHVQDLSLALPHLAAGRMEAARVVQSMLDQGCAQLRLAMHAGAAQGVVGVADLGCYDAGAYRPDAAYAWHIERQVDAGASSYVITDKGTLGFRWRPPGTPAWGRWSDAPPCRAVRLPAGSVVQFPDAALPAGLLAAQPGADEGGADGDGAGCAGEQVRLQARLPGPGAPGAHAGPAAPFAPKPALPPASFVTSEVMDCSALRARFLAMLAGPDRV